MAGFGRLFFTAGSALSYRSILSTRSCLPNIQSCSLRTKVLNTILEKLGLPLKPNRPPTPYNVFVGREYKMLRPNMKSQAEILKIISERWHNIDPEEKAKLQENYESEIKVWVEKAMDYHNSMSPEQSELLTKALKQREAKSERRILSKERREQGKPKRPSPFSVFMNHKGPRPADLKATEWFKVRGEEWRAMSEEERAKYKAMFEEQLTQYRKDMEEWEEKMLRQGRTDLLSDNVLKKIKASGKSKTMDAE